jgi:hypothetical protein
MTMQIANRKSEIANGEWLPDMDLNHDKQIQSLLCYRYTIGQAGAWGRLDAQRQESRFVKALNRYTVESIAPVQRFNGSTVQSH